MAKFNYRELAKALASSEIGRKRVNTVIQRQFEQVKREMLDDYDNHPVTQEIEEGAGASNQSGTLNGEGDLFSFIGFEEGSAPAQEVRDVLESETALGVSKRGVANGTKVQYKFSLRIPIESIRRESPLPFETGKSWVDGIERGISGFGNYLRGRFNESRSGGGIQSKNTIRQTAFKPRKFLSEIFAAFVNKFR